MRGGCPDPRIRTFKVACLTRGLGRKSRLGVVALGLLLGQLALFAPSMVGRKILLPLDLLALPNTYLPASSVSAGNPTFTDLLFAYEMSRRFTAAEFRAGRIPTWNPDSYTGAPFANFPKYSPFLWPYYVFNAPWALAWIQFLTALVAGMGAYAFFRIALRLSFWPSTLIAWCVPLSGFFVLWQGFALVYSVALFPWMLLAVHLTVHDPRFGPAVAGVTFFTLISGQIDLAGQVLLASGIYGLGLLVHRFSGRRRARVLHSGASPAKSPTSSRTASPTSARTASPTSPPAPSPASAPAGARDASSSSSTGTSPIASSEAGSFRALGGRAAALLAGWGLGLLLAAPYLFPLVEYTHTGSRLASRLAGAEERPPIGLSALPQVFDPNYLGSVRAGSIYFGIDNHMESPAAAYAGVLLTLVLAPLAWRNRRHRTVCIILTTLVVLALSWDLALPGLVEIWRAPVLRYFSYNRFVFVSSFAIAALAAIGLESLRDRRRLSWRWTLVPSLAALALGALAVVRASAPPFALTRLIAALPASGAPGRHLVDTPAEVDAILRSFRSDAIQHAVVCCAAIALLLLLQVRSRRAHESSPRENFGLPVAIAGLAVLELLMFGRGFSPQADPELYLPSIPTLEQLPTEDRVLGFNCLPPELHRRFRFREVRGYDGVDPSAILDLLDRCRDPKVPVLAYARAQYFVPIVRLAGDGSAAVSPLLSLANVRYLLFRGQPPEHAVTVLRGDDYWILENRRACPRAFVPARVESVTDASARLVLMARDDFDPRAVAFVETDLDLPDACVGRASITDTSRPDRMTLEAEMSTSGLLFISDLYDRGWRARVNGADAPILRTNHAFRGIILPPGPSTIEMTYRPASLTLALSCFAAAFFFLVSWIAALQLIPKRDRPPRAPHALGPKR